jgi:Entner-Doudoroff aldolase
VLSPSGERVSLAQLTHVEVKDGACDIYREGSTRYAAVTFNVRGRDLGTTVEEAIRKIREKVKMPPGYSVGWSGEYESEKRAEARLAVIVPLTVLVIFIILYTMFRSFKWSLLILVNVLLARVGGFLALLVTGTYFSVSSGVGMLALFGVSGQTGVIMVEYINQLRSRGHTIVESAVEGAVLRLRPIMMTMLVATGGVTNAAVARQCLDAEAQFFTSDGLHPTLIEFAVKEDVVVFPGALTPTEVIAAWESGVDFVKVVPCAQIGGETYIGSLHRMFPNIPLIASGGVNQQNASKFILAGALALGVGRELIPTDAIRLRQVDRIGELARRFLSFVKSGRDHLAARLTKRMAIDEE